ncbi:NUDIX hydrolase [Streptomyces cinnamoneus]|uniref:NUDIX hydrolase n=1 Tax=Streptomyces cinnamoneus TaxID=53446 RepID=UPI000CEE72AD|nr:NUDIX domain-containing protein [Streptomyces cinnamoneus]PPT14776.1 DNA mismatch repair protein MutT [Streptomyces cinnamoneus]
MPAQRPINDAMLILERNGLVLLAERAGTGYADGLLNLPSGKVDQGEDVVTAAIREAREEVGVDVAPEAVRIVHVTHFLNPEGEPRVGWFLATSHWTGEPRNAEPHKCAGIAWHPIGHLPDTVVPYNAHGIGQYLKGEPFSVLGWP